MPRGLSTLGISTLGTNPTQLQPLTAQQLTERFRKLLRRPMINVDSDDESLSALPDDDYGNFVTIDEADDL